MKAYKVFVFVLLSLCLFLFTGCDVDANTATIDDGDYCYIYLSSNPALSYVRTQTNITIKDESLYFKFDDSESFYKLKRCKIDKDVFEIKSAVSLLYLNEYSHDIIENIKKEKKIDGFKCEIKAGTVYKTTYYFFTFKGAQYLWIVHKGSSSDYYQYDFLVNVTNKDVKSLLELCKTNSGAGYNIWKTPRKAKDSSTVPSDVVGYYSYNKSFGQLVFNTINDIADWKEIENYNEDDYKYENNAITIGFQGMYGQIIRLIVKDDKLYAYSIFTIGDEPVLKYYTENKDAIEMIDKVINIKDENGYKYYEDQVVTSYYDESIISKELQEASVQYYLDIYGEIDKYLLNGTKLSARIVDCISCQHGWLLKFEGCESSDKRSEEEVTIYEYLDYDNKEYTTTTYKFKYKDNNPYYFYYGNSNVCTIVDAYSLVVITKDELASFENYLNNK
ncbi:MAG: hypothetical protein IJS58_03610 [Bacilli bacterium]|nr:hypothetical protein [Bacilli bacterium]